VDQLPPFRVLLHNDDVNTIDHVVDSIVELTPLDHGRAVEVTLEAQQSGAALVLVTHQERAELYRDQFVSKSLTVSIEPVE
jgi:ATP-dependent Clp protease adaptor protein ClpS